MQCTEVNKERKSVKNMEVTDLGVSWCFQTQSSYNTITKVLQWGLKPQYPSADYLCRSCLPCLLSPGDSGQPLHLHKIMRIQVVLNLDLGHMAVETEVAFLKVWFVSELEPHMKVAQNRIWKERISCDLCCSHGHWPIRSGSHREEKSESGHLGLLCERSHWSFISRHPHHHTVVSPLLSSPLLSSPLLSSPLLSSQAV